MGLPNILTNRLKSLNKKREEIYPKFTKLQKELEVLDGKIEYLKELSNIKPQLLYNQGREKKYIYGQIYWYTDGYNSKKKSFRFLIGKMSDKKSRKVLKEQCLEHFYSKIIPSIESF